MKTIRKKSFILTILATIGFSLFLISQNSNLFAKNILDETEASYPINSILDDKKLSKKKDIELGFEIDYPTQLSYSKTERRIGKEILRNVVNISDPNNPNDSRFNLEIIPVKSDSADTALAALEKYIVNYVGIIPKNNQETFKIENLDVAQIGYNPFQGDGMNYFRVFTLYKNGDYSLIFTLGYFGEMTEKDSLQLDKNAYTKIYLEILNSLKVSLVSKEENFNPINLSNIKQTWLKQYHDNNLKFETDI